MGAEQQPFVVSKKLFLEYAKGDLAEVADKFSKDVVILSHDQMEALKKIVHISNIRRECGKMGGRPKLPELTSEEVEALPAEEKQRYKMRMWKRNSRLRKQDEKNDL